MEQQHVTCLKLDSVMNKLLLKLFHKLIHFLSVSLVDTLRNAATHPPSQNTMNVCLLLMFDFVYFYVLISVGPATQRRMYANLFSKTFTFTKKNQQDKKTIIYRFV